MGCGRRSWLALVVVFLAAVGCQRKNPAYGGPAADAGHDGADMRGDGQGGTAGGKGGAGGQGGAAGGGGGSAGAGGGTGGGAAMDGSAGAGGGGTGGAAGTPPSCAGLPAACGPSGTESCCASPLVPGGTYNRSNDPMYPATVSDFRLDRFEITVGRFRKFVEAGKGTKASPPAAGSGANPHAAGTGWDAAWNASLPSNSTALEAALRCSAYQTWTEGPGENEKRPQNCIHWYEAFAFCIWDGGRLPTEAEWNYAAAGGGEQRVYPWSVPPTSKMLDGSYAVYCGTSCSAAQNVGSKSPKGDGKWGHADLAGNLWEWNFDWFASPYQNPCDDCADTTSDVDRVIRGGSFAYVPSSLLSGFRWHFDPTARDGNFGARCARAP